MNTRVEIHDSWSQGVDHFNAGRYWHAHESWEFGWKKLPSLEKLHVQCMIQVAAVLYLCEKGRLRPALALCDSVLAKRKALRGIGLTPRIEVLRSPSGIRLLRRELSVHHKLPADWSEFKKRLRAKLVGL